MHLFGHNPDHDYYFELPRKGERDTQSITHDYDRGDVVCPICGSNDVELQPSLFYAVTQRRTLDLE
jgi:hypothetical protein